MDIGPYVDYLFILVVVPIVILVVIIIAVEMFRAYYDSLGIKINELNSQIRFRLGQIEDQFKKIEEINAQNFVIDDPEPYGSGVQKLQEQLVQGRAQYTSQVTRRKKLAQQKFSPPTGRLVWILYYWQALHYRMKRHQQFRALQQIVESLETNELQEARNLLTKLQEYPTVVQQKIKGLQEINLDTIKLTKELFEVKGFVERAVSYFYLRGSKQTLSRQLYRQRCKRTLKFAPMTPDFRHTSSCQPNLLRPATRSR